MNRTYLLFDHRAAAGQGTSDASVLVACCSEPEARSWIRDFPNASCYSYNADGESLTDERWEWDAYDGRIAS